MMTDIKKWFNELWQDFLDWLKEFGQNIILEIKDLSLDLFELFLDGAVFAISTIAPPEFLATSLDVIAGGMPPALLYFLSQTGISQGFSIFGSAVMFRIARKIYTLGAW